MAALFVSLITRSFMSFINKRTPNSSLQNGLSIHQLCALISGVIYNGRLSRQINQNNQLLHYPVLVGSSEVSLRADSFISWEDILSPILWAAPKKRTSHSRKRLRMTNKWLKPIYHYTFCNKCGNPKLPHVLCGTCFKGIMKKTAEYRRNVDMTQ